MTKSVYRVNYYVNGVAVTGYVCAESDVAASAFLGVRDGSAAVNVVASPVEVAGVDKPHAALVGAPINVAPPEPPAQVDRHEFEALKQQLADLHKKMAGQGTPVKP